MHIQSRKRGDFFMIRIKILISPFDLGEEFEAEADAATDAADMGPAPDNNLYSS